MRVGILTFHSQLNYGGILQCYALKWMLEHMGHDVLIVDRWIDKTNSSLLGPMHPAGVKEAVRYAIQIFILPGMLRTIGRYIRTISFIRNKFKLTPYHFVFWKDAPTELGLDGLVVGSDQVWNCSYQDPAAYLLQGCPPIPAISYAASLGVDLIPCDKLNTFRLGLQRFARIGVREHSSVAMLKGLCPAGKRLEHVVDPTILVPRDCWYSIIPRAQKKRRLACYFLGMELESYMADIVSFANNQNAYVEIFVNPPDDSLKGCLRNLFSRCKVELKALLSRHVVIRRSAGPLEFLRAIAGSQMVLTDSFHATVLGLIYDCNVRVVRPASSSRQKMFARIEELGQDYSNETLIAESVPEALSSFERGEVAEINNGEMLRAGRRSAIWLKEALDSMVQGEL